MTTAERIKVMQAYVDGKSVEFRVDNSDDVWSELGRVEEPVWNWDIYEYRIHPQKVYKPYKNAYEMAKDFEHRFMDSRYPDHAMPLIWVKDSDGVKYLIIAIMRDGVGMYDGEVSFNELFTEFTYLDRSPCGKLVE